MNTPGASPDCLPSLDAELVSCQLSVVSGGLWVRSYWLLFIELVRPPWTN